MFNFKDKLANIVFFVVLVLTIGFPRVYGTEIPMAMFLIPFFALGFIRTLIHAGVFSFLFLFLFLFGLLLGVISYSVGEGQSGDLFFHFVIYFKIFLIFFFAYVVSQCIYNRPGVLLCWILFQMLIVFIASFNQSFYEILLGFISPRSAEVFQHIFGLRSLGFGLFHMEGSITLIFAVFLYVLLNVEGKKYSSMVLVLLSLPFSMSIARSAIVPFSIFAFFTKGIILKFAIFLVLSGMFLIAFFVESGPLYQAVEIFRNVIAGEGASSESVTHLASMYSFPTDIYTYLIGDGMYYSVGESLSFYMNTDVGYMRILYFSGIFSLFVFVVLNTFFMLLGILRFRGAVFRGYGIYFFVSFLVFFIINAKGIQVVPLFGLVLFYYAFRLRSESVDGLLHSR